MTQRKFAVFSGILSFAAVAPASADQPVLTLHAITMSVGSLVQDVNPLLLSAGVALLAGVIAYRVLRAG